MQKERKLKIILKLVIKSQEKRAKEEKNKKRTINNRKQLTKMIIRTQLSIITLNVNKLFQSKYIEWLMGFRKRPIYTLPIRDSLKI